MMGDARGNNLNRFNRHILDVNHLHLRWDGNRCRLKYGRVDFLIDRNGRVELLRDRRSNLYLCDRGIANLYRWLIR